MIPAEERRRLAGAFEEMIVGDNFAMLAGLLEVLAALVLVLVVVSVMCWPKR